MISLNNIQDAMPQILNEESNKSRSNSNVYYYKFNKLVKVNSALDSNNASTQKQNQSFPSAFKKTNKIN
jgi:hypothetical protein